MQTRLVEDYPLIIGFGYKARNGKNSAAEAIRDAFPQYDIRLFAFGDELKVEFYDALQTRWHDYWRSRDFPLHIGKPVPKAVAASVADKIEWVNAHKADYGHDLQLYGTEFRRDQDPFYWVNKLRARILDEKPAVALISDVRFKNEAYFVRDYRGLLVKVTRYGYELEGRDSNHVSECQLDDFKFDFEISVLDGELGQLKRDAKMVFQLIVEARYPEQEILPDAAVQYC